MTSASQSDRPPTIIEVARLAGVSFKTVARVMNNEPGVRPAKREAVNRAAKMLGYVRNVSARQLAGSRSFLIAFLFDVPSDYVARAQAGAIVRCREAGYHLVVEEVRSGHEMDTARRLHGLRIDGVVLNPGLARNPIMVSALRDLGIRYVLISPEGCDPRDPSVKMDDRRAAYEMTQLLLSLGHREIAFISGGARPSSQDRRAGFIEALEEAGITLPAEFDLAGDFGFKSGEANGDKLFGGARRPTAVFAANDTMAVGAMVAAARFGVKIPAQVSVVGFDDSVLASIASPQLTTVRQPVRAMAKAAVDLLLEGGDANTRSPHQSFEFRIIERESTGRVPS